VDYKVIAIYTALYLIIGIILGVSEGLLLGHADGSQLFTSGAYFWGELIVSLAIDIAFFLHLFKNKLNFPLFSAAIIVLCSWSIDSGAVYLLTGVKPQYLLVAISNYSAINNP
jgi:hypothetical protein